MLFLMGTLFKETSIIVMYEVISKRKMALDQLRKRFTTLGVLDEMSKHPRLFESVFTFKHVKSTPATVKGCDRAQKPKMMMTRFVNQSSSSRLVQSMQQYCTGSKMIPTAQKFAMNVNVHSENYTLYQHAPLHS